MVFGAPATATGGQGGGFNAGLMMYEDPSKVMPLSK